MPKTIRILSYFGHGHLPTKTPDVQVLCRQAWSLLVRGDETKIAALARATGGEMKVPPAGWYMDPTRHRTWVFLSTDMRLVDGPEAVLASLPPEEQAQAAHLDNPLDRLLFLDRAIEGALSPRLNP